MEHFEHLHDLMARHPSLHLDFSWDVAFAHFSDPAQKRELARLVNAYPTRVAYGTDGIGNDYKSSFSNLNIAKNEFLVHLDKPQLFLRGNAKSWITEANRNVMDYRLGNKDALAEHEPRELLNDILPAHKPIGE